MGVIAAGSGKAFHALAILGSGARWHGSMVARPAKSQFILDSS